MERCSGDEPQVLMIRLLEACNAGCFMCSFAFSNDRYRYPLEEAHDLAERVSGSGVQHVRFTGGEPLMHPDCTEMVRVFKRVGVNVSLITNGYWLSDRAAELADAGLDQVVVSIDAARARSHDRFRKLPGLFQRAVDGLEVSEGAFNRRVNSVIGPHNIGQLLDMYDLFTGLRLEQWSIQAIKDPLGGRVVVDSDRMERVIEEFAAMATRPLPLLIGSPDEWIGRTPAERRRFFDEGVTPTPRPVCKVVDRVRYLVPGSNSLFPCNCLPHRVGEQAASVEFDGNVDGPEIRALADRLRATAPDICRGCKPVNVAFGEVAKTTSDEILSAF